MCRNESLMKVRELIRIRLAVICWMELAFYVLIKGVMQFTIEAINQFAVRVEMNI